MFSFQKLSWMATQFNVINIVLKMSCVALRYNLINIVLRMSCIALRLNVLMNFNKIWRMTTRFQKKQNNNNYLGRKTSSVARKGNYAKMKICMNKKRINRRKKKYAKLKICLNKKWINRRKNKRKKRKAFVVTKI